MKIALAQMKMSSDVSKNYEKTVKLIKKASQANCDLVFFPEIQLTQFFPQYEKIEVKEYLMYMDSPYIKGIIKACKDNDIYASPNLYICEDGKNYDMSLLINNHGEVIGKQKMVYIAQQKNFYEKDYYTPSDEGFNVFDTDFGKIGIVVCFDRHIPNSIQTLALKGADLIIIPTANTVDEPSEMFKWEIKVQAFQNSVNVAMCNRAGVENQMTFSGESIVADYNGETLAIGSLNEELIITDIDMVNTKDVRKNRGYLELL